MNIPREFVEGGLTYSGSSVSIRMLENILHDYVERSNRLNNWIVQKISELTGVHPIDVKYTKFKMADDVQIKGAYANLATSNFISSKKLGDIMDYDSEVENKQIAKEQVDKMIEQARVQAKAQYVMTQIQNEYANSMPTVMGNFKNPMDPAQTDQIKQQVQGLPPEQQQQAMDQLGQQDPYAAQTVSGALDTNNQNLAQDLMKMDGLDESQAQEAMEQIYYTNPKKYQLLKLFFTPSSGKVPAKLNSNPSEVSMAPAPQILPPRGVNRSM
jgi:hypothetical protein